MLAIHILTFQNEESIRQRGGYSALRLNPKRAQGFEYAVLCRNANNHQAQGPEPHGQAFLVGRMSDVRATPTRRPGRQLLAFSEYARVSIPNAWRQQRLPFRYATLEELGIDPDKLEWLPMPSSEAPSAAAADMFPREASRVLAIIAERRAALAQELGVPVEAIDIKLGPPPLQAA